MDKAKLRRLIELAGEVAPIIAMAGLRSPWLGRVGIGLKLLQLGEKFYQESQVSPCSPWEYFGQSKNSSGEWKHVNRIFLSIFMAHTVDERIVARQGAAVTAKEGTVQGCKVGWIEVVGKDKTSAGNVWIAIKDQDKFKDVLCELLWAQCPSVHMEVGAKGLEPDLLAPDDRFLRTNLVERLQTRVESFLADGNARSYLLVGRPGTGKTTCIQHVVRTLGLRSLRIPLTELCHSRGYLPTDDIPLKTILEVAQPDVVIIDDVDRVDIDGQNELLDLVQVARKHVKILVASANHLEPIIAPLKRVERFDDHIDVPQLPIETVESILGEHSEHAPRMADWPIAYILDFLRRVRVIGLEAAKGEIDNLEKRIMEDNVPVLHS